MTPTGPYFLGFMPLCNPLAWSVGETWDISDVLNTAEGTGCTLVVMLRHIKLCFGLQELEIRLVDCLKEVAHGMMLKKLPWLGIAG